MMITLKIVFTLIVYFALIVYDESAPMRRYELYGVPDKTKEEI